MRLYTNCQASEIPEALKAFDSWMVSIFQERPDGRLDKPPCRIDGARVYRADKTKAKNRCSFSEAVEAVEAGKADAIGFVFTKDDPFAVVDQDHVIDCETGQITKAALHVAGALNTYTELSVSGEGLHSIGEAEKPGPNCRRDDLGIEIYDGSTGARFMVITGNVLDSLSPADKQIHRRQRVVNDLYRQWWPEKPQVRRKPSFERPLDMSDAELLDSARNARKTGAKFQKLYDRGDWSGYKSQSNADYALINLLTYRCAGERDRIVDLFMRSALFRPPPEKAADYVERSVDKFLSTYTGDFYQPRAIGEKPVEEQRDILDPYLAELLDVSAWKGPKASAAWKVYAHMIIQVAELGVEAKSGELVVGSDVRTIAEGAGVNRK